MTTTGRFTVRESGPLIELLDREGKVIASADLGADHSKQQREEVLASYAAIAANANKHLH